MEEQDDGQTLADGTPVFEDDASALIGADVGGYIVERELGRGGMGVVYAATHPVIGKRVAIKLLKHSLSRNPASVERFLQEARSVNQIGHPNIVDIFAFGRLEDGRHYLVMDLLEGEPLRKRIKRGALPVGEAVQLFDEIASALAAAHAKGFIHRDLKPDNVFLVANPSRFEVKLLDFGLAKLLPTGSLESERTFRTATGAMIGTPDYMSPEQLRGTGVDHRTDIYALGIMAFECLTRSRPHRFPDGTFDLEGLTFKQALLAMPAVPESLAELIETMVSRDPVGRPTLTAVRAVLKRVKNNAAGAVGSSNTRPAGSETSIEAFSPSQLGARPVFPTPPTGAPTYVEQPMSQPAIGSQPPGSVQPPSQPFPSSPPVSPPLPSFRAPGSGAPLLATRLGVQPAKALLQQRAPVPYPAAPPPARPAESRLWLYIGLAVLAAGAAVLAFVLAG